ncbi:hypothetical protein KM043_009707 [Ampulex compressa]|nr:hypothetical protein KM043_009707 [Ampulex compressa]
MHGGDKFALKYNAVRKLADFAYVPAVSTCPQDCEAVQEELILHPEPGDIREYLEVDRGVIATSIPGGRTRRGGLETVNFRRGPSGVPFLAHSVPSRVPWDFRVCSCTLAPSAIYRSAWVCAHTWSCSCSLECRPRSKLARVTSELLAFDNLAYVMQGIVPYRSGAFGCIHLQLAASATR